MHFIQKKGGKGLTSPPLTLNHYGKIYIINIKDIFFSTLYDQIPAPNLARIDFYWTFFYFFVLFSKKNSAMAIDGLNTT